MLAHTHANRMLPHAKRRPRSRPPHAQAHDGSLSASLCGQFTRSGFEREQLLLSLHSCQGVCSTSLATNGELQYLVDRFLRSVHLHLKDLCLGVAVIYSPLWLKFICVCIFLSLGVCGRQIKRRKEEDGSWNEIIKKEGEEINIKAIRVHRHISSLKTARPSSPVISTGVVCNRICKCRLIWRG